VTDENQKRFEAVCEEWDAQWAIFRVLKSAESRDVEMIKSIRQELREAGVSNLGLGVE
jgi:Uncharacterized protein conserved in bacteria